MAKKIVLQDLRRFVVEVVNPETGTCVGTGVIISDQGRIATCSHVVDAARPSDSSHIQVVLPASIAGHDEPLDVDAEATAPEFDLAVLLPIETIAIPADHVAIVGPVGQPLQNRFTSYGFRELADQIGGYASGRILGHVQIRRGVRQSDGLPPVQLESSQISGGMSGAPVLDNDRNLVVGLISDTWFPDDTTKDRDTAWAIDLANLPLVLADVGNLVTDEAPKGNVEMEIADSEVRGLVPQVVAARLGNPGAHLKYAAPPLPNLRGRSSILLDLADEYGEDHIAVTSLVGFGGEGKSSIIRSWVDDRLNETSEPLSLFWWAFDGNPSLDDFFRALIGHYVDLSSLSSDVVNAIHAVDTRAQLSAHLLSTSRTVIVLDGLEAIADASASQGLSDEMRTFVRRLATNDASTFCIIGSRLPVSDLIDLESHSTLAVKPLRDSDAIRLLEDHGAVGPPRDLERICGLVANHALSLVVIGGLVASKHEGDASQFAGLEELRVESSVSETAARFERLLAEYDEILTDADRAILLVLAVQRRPMPMTVFDKVAQGRSGPGSLIQPLASLTRTQYRQRIKSLKSLGLVQVDDELDALSLHPILRGHYVSVLDDEGSSRRRGLFSSLTRAYAASVAPGTFGKVGFGIASVAGGILARSGGPIGAGINAAGTALSSDENASDAAHFGMQSLRSKRMESTDAGKA